MTARWLNTVGLLLGMAGVVILFIWGPPQPNFIEGDVYVDLRTKTAHRHLPPASKSEGASIRSCPASGWG